MAGFIWEVGKFLYKQEVTFGVDPTTDTYIPLISRPDLSGAGKAYWPADNMKQGVYMEEGIVGHGSEATMSISHYMHGWSSTAPASLVGPTAVHPDAELASLALGNYTLYDAGSGDAFVSATTVDADKFTVNVDADPDAAGYKAGDVIGIETDNGYEYGVIKTVTAAPTGPIVLRAELSTDQIAGAASDLVWNGSTVFTTTTFQQSSVAANIGGQDASDDALLLGGRPTSYKITANPRDFAMAEMELLFNSIERDNAGGAPAATSYGYPARREIMGGCLVLWDGTDRIELDCSTFELDLGLEVVQPLDPCNDQGAGDPILTNRTPRITINPLQTSDVKDGAGAGDNKLDPPAAFEAGTSFDLRYYWGTPGNAICISAPACRLVEFPQPADRDSLTAWPLVFECQSYTGDTGTAELTDNVPGDKDLCIGFV